MMCGGSVCPCLLPRSPMSASWAGLHVSSTSALSASLPAGAQVLATDPYQLFSFAGVRRLDAVLDVAAGRVDIAAYILDQDAGEEADVG